MMNVLSENLPFLGSIYNMSSAFLLIGLIVAVDACLRGFAMWRAARMQKLVWFIGLLLINSFGVLPIVFLMLTKNEYARLRNNATMGTPSLDSLGTR